VEVDLDKYTPCVHPKLQENYVCPPRVFPTTTHRLFRNKGDGTFADISQSSGIASAAPAPGLGVVLLDLDLDGKLDVYAANDMMPAYLFHNQGAASSSKTACCPAVLFRPTDATWPVWASASATWTAAAGHRCSSPTTRTSRTTCF
jgi:hypothetical protein